MVSRRAITCTECVSVVCVTMNPSWAVKPIYTKSSGFFFPSFFFFYIGVPHVLELRVDVASHCFNRVRVGGCVCGTHSALEGTSPRRVRLPIRTGATYLFIYYRQLPHIPLFYFIFFHHHIGNAPKTLGISRLPPANRVLFSSFFFFSCAH